MINPMVGASYSQSEDSLFLSSKSHGRIGDVLLHVKLPQQLDMVNREAEAAMSIQGHS